MKKFICAILICLMLTPCFMLVGCDNTNYNLSQFYTTYENIGTNAINLTLVEANDTYQLNVDSKKIDINYSKSTKLKSLVENDSSQYYQLKHLYQQLLDDSLSPLYFFGQSISNSKKVSDKQTEALFKTLAELEQEYTDIDYYVGILINSLNATDDETVNLSNLKKVFLQYEQTITVANNLSSLICDIYFNKVLTTARVDYSTKAYNELTEADLGRISVDTRTRMYYYKSVYANIYNQLFVRNNNLADQIILHPTQALPEYAPYTFAKDISSLNNKSIENLTGNKQQIYTNVVSLYNIENSFDVAYNNFNIATSKIAYADLDASSSVDGQNYGAIITQFSNGIAYDSYEILNNLVNLLYL